MIRPLDADFNRVILELAPVHVASARVPVFTAATSPRYTRELLRADGLLVWDGASERTIYADARVNFAFRAWHDACHIAGDLGFTLEGERGACEMQKRQLVAAYPRAPRRWLALLDAEIIGQLEELERTGAFPLDQAGFVARALEGL